MTNEILICYYGDDFTGTADAMESLARAGLKAISFIEPPDTRQLEKYPGIQAFGVAGISRSLKTEELENELIPVFESFKKSSPKIVHYKCCSTFDSSPEIGSIGKAIELGASCFTTKSVPLVVGAPILGRYVVFGNLFARSGLDNEPCRLDRHPTMTRHPITPMNESDLRRHLHKQTELNIELIDVLKHELNLEERTLFHNTLLDKKPSILLYDALYPEHMKHIGEWIWSQVEQSAHPLFTIGSSGVEYALTALWEEKKMCQPHNTFPDPGKVSPLLVLSGSCSPVTKNQIETAAQCEFDLIPVQTDLCIESDRVGEETLRVAKLAIQKLQNGQSVIVHTALGPDDQRILKTKSLLKEKGFNDLDIKLKSGKFFGEALAKIMEIVLDEVPLKRAATTGGDTSGYFAKSLGIEALEMICPIAPGSPLCHLYKSNSRLDGLQMTFKGGQVGKKDFFSAVRRGKA